MEKEWSTMTREEKREERFRRWISPETEFESPEAADAYKERVTRLSRALLLEEPDRVPVILPAGIVGLSHDSSSSEYASASTTPDRGLSAGLARAGPP